MLRFCKFVDKYLGENRANVIAVHCKGGKGRTGTMICAYLLYCGTFDSPDAVLDYFAMRRTAEFGEREGVEVCLIGVVGVCS